MKKWEGLPWQRRLQIEEAEGETRQMKKREELLTKEHHNLKSTYYELLRKVALEPGQASCGLVSDALKRFGSQVSFPLTLQRLLRMGSLERPNRPVSREPRH